MKQITPPHSLKLNLMFLLVLCFNSIQAQVRNAHAIWYVSSSYTGSISNGSIDKPFKTLAEANNYVDSRDDVYLKRGDTFYGTIDLDADADDIIYSAYGDTNLPKPKVSGALYIYYNIEETQNNIYKYPLTTKPKIVTDVFGNLLQIGRTPNSNAANGGYYTYRHPGTDAPNRKYIKASNVAELVDEVKEVVIRTENYIIETKPVDTIDKDSLKIYYKPTTGFNGSNYSRPPNHRYGYYFQNGINTLDADGEWYYDEGVPGDSSDNRLCVYYAQDPGYNVPLTVSTQDVLCNLHDNNDIVIQNIDFEYANRMGIDMGNNEDNVVNVNILIQHCNFNLIGVRAIHARHTKELYVYDCDISNCLSGGVQFITHFYNGWQSLNKIEACNFTNIAPWPGMAYNTDEADNCAVAAYTSHQSEISFNSFDNIGKAAILWQGNAVSITNNKISNAVKNFADYGAIYTFQDTNSARTFSNRLIENNLIYDCPSNIDGTLLSNHLANGIYLDGQTGNTLVKNNTVINVGNGGIVCNTPKDVELVDNLLYNNAYGIRFSHLQDYRATENISLTLKGNKIYNQRGQVNTNLKNTGNSMAAAINFFSAYNNWEEDLQNVSGDGNVYGLTNPIPFSMEVNATANRPSKLIGLYKWQSLVSDGGVQAFPDKWNFMPNGKVYQIKGNATNFIPLYNRLSIPDTSEWNTNDYTATKSVENGELKIEFPAYVPNGVVSFRRKLLGKTLYPNQKYVFSYEIRAETGKNGVCHSYARISGTNVPAWPTADNYRTYNEEPVTLKYLVYSPDTLIEPVFCINIDKTSGTTYISKIKVQPYNENDVDIDSAENYVYMAYNPNWHQPAAYTYTLPPVTGFTYYSGFGLETDSEFDFDESFQSVLMFKFKATSGRPYNVLPPFAPDNKKNILAYPNPVKDVLKISSLNSTDNWQQLDIINTEGKTILSLPITKGNTGISVPVASLKKGLYIASLKNNRGSPYTIRFIKN
jgi:hypothetical protein